MRLLPQEWMWPLLRRCAPRSVVWRCAMASETEDDFMARLLREHLETEEGRAEYERIQEAVKRWADA